VRGSVAFAAAFIVVSCSQAQPQSHVSPRPSPSLVASGCGEYPLLSGNEPRWLDDAGAHNNPTGVPYVIATPPIAAGFVFGYPLTAGRTEPSNKILWVVGKPWNGSPLIVGGHPVGAQSPSDGWRFEADSGPGDIYPSIVNVPQAGCWQFDLGWAGNHAMVDLNYS
jgi:hypothetical protein